MYDVFSFCQSCHSNDLSLLSHSILGGVLDTDSMCDFLYKGYALDSKKALHFLREGNEGFVRWVAAKDPAIAVLPFMSLVLKLMLMYTDD